MLKRHCVELLLPHDVVELILERLPVKSVLRFMAVSKKWRSTIETRRFQERQLVHRKQSRGPDVLFVSISYHGDDGLTDTQRFVVGSSLAYTVRFPTSGNMVCHGSCDGLVCFFHIYVDKPCVVVNPATRWHQSFPISNIQQLLVDCFDESDCFDVRQIKSPTPNLGFGKDKFRDTYKAVWLCNSYEFGLDNVTTCEVFDFSTNAWRYVVPASSYRILADQRPVYLDGSLYWLTDCEEVKVLSFDLHTETFQVICKAPVARDPDNLTMCILDNRLCVSEKKWPVQLIWSFESSGGSKIWKQMCSIDLTKMIYWFDGLNLVPSPIAILDKNKLLLQGRDYLQPLVIYNLDTKSSYILFQPNRPMRSLCYFQTLFSTFSIY